MQFPSSSFRSIRHRLVAVLLGALVLLFAQSFSTLSQTGHGFAPLRVDRTHIEWPMIAPHVTALRDPSRMLNIDDVRDGAGFSPLETETADFGYTKDMIWLRLGLVNETDTDAWRIHFRENFFQFFEVYRVAEDGSVRVVERQTEQSGFTSRAVRYPELVAGLNLEPGEAATVFVRFWSGGNTEVSFQLMSPEVFAGWAAQKTARNFLYYGMLLILSLAAFVAWLVTWRSVFGAYALYAMFALLFIAHADGNTFQYLWPNAPAFNSFASVILGVGIVSSGANFARQFLQTQIYHPILDKLMVGLMLVMLGMLLATLVVDTQTIKKLLVLASLIGVGLFTTSGLIAARTRFRDVRFFVIAWFGAVVASTIMNLRHWLGIEISEEVQFDSMRLVFVLDAALMGLAIIDRVNQIRQNRQEVLELSLSEARKTVTLTARLQELENQFRVAEEMSRLRARTLTDTVHDLRQPLHALRLNVQNIVRGGGAGGGAIADVEQTFTYLEDLISRELDQQVQDAALDHVNGKAAPSDMLAVGEVIRTVTDMLEPDAAAKGVDLRAVDTSARTPLPAIVLMRLLSNLVGNAVKYTGAGKILVGLRRTPDGPRIEVHDTGPGMSADAFDAALSRHARLPETIDQPGHGIGLSLVRDLAEEHGLRITHLPRPDGAGTSIAVYLPQ